MVLWEGYRKESFSRGNIAILKNRPEEKRVVTLGSVPYGTFSFAKNIFNIIWGN